MNEKANKMSLFHYTWPIFIELVLQMLVGNVDQMMMSQVSQNAVGAIGNANQILNVLIITFSVISLATTILVSQYFGKENLFKVAETYTLAVAVNLFLGVIIGLLLVLFNQPIFAWMQVPQALMKDCMIYITIVGIGIPFQALYLTYASMFRTQGWMKETMVISAMMNVINIAGNFILITGFGPFGPLGIAGVAISSTVSRLMGLVLLVVVFNIKSTIHVDLKTITPFPWHSLKKLMAIGIPSGGESISYNMSQMMITKMVNQFGPAVINTRVYGNMFAMVSYIYGSAVSQAAQIIVGYRIGARQLDKANKQVIKTLIYSVLVGLAVSITLFLYSDVLFGLFTQEAAVLALGKKIMFIEIFLEVGRAINMTQVRSLQAAGDINFPILLGIASQWGISVVLSWVFGVMMGFGLVGVWVAMAIDECLRAVLFLIRWFSQAWRTKNLIEG